MVGRGGVGNFSSGAVLVETNPRECVLMLFLLVLTCWSVQDLLTTQDLSMVETIEQELILQQYAYNPTMFFHDITDLGAQIMHINDARAPPPTLKSRLLFAVLTHTRR